MCDGYILKNLEIQVQRDNVLAALDCKKESPLYEEFVEEYREVDAAVSELLEPIGIFDFGALTEETATERYTSGTNVIFAITSIGDKISQYSSTAFEKGDYVKGMIADAYGAEALFSLEEPLLCKLKEVCAQHQLGIVQRLEAPVDIPMEVQKLAWEQLHLKARFGIEISSAYMYRPIKTSCQVFVLTEDADIFKAQHDCASCPNRDCKRRKSI